jgi:hypothetical protein
MEEYIAKVVRLSEILEQPPEVSLNTNLSELEEIVDGLRPEDFALLGKSLCHLLIDIASVKRIRFIEEKTPPPPPPACPVTPPPERSAHRRRSSGSPYYTQYPDFIPTSGHRS